MSDAKWTSATTQQAIALWVGGKDVAEIAVEFGVAPGEVLSRIARAAIAGEDAPAAVSAAPGAAPAEAAPPKSGLPKSGLPRSAATKSAAPKAASSKALAAPKTRNSTVSTIEAAPTPAAAKPEGAARTPVPQPGGPAADAGPPAPRPSALRLVPTPPALVVKETPDAAPSAASPVAARGYEAVALPAPVRTAKRLLVAADGGAGVPFMKATTLDCHFPLWADTETVSIERKRVCGCRALAGKSWCAHHLSAVFEPPRKPQPRVA